MITPAKLGKKPAKFDVRTLQISKYMVKMPHVPINFNWFDKVPSWPMYGNDTLGDCVEAAMGHSLEQWTIYANPPGFVPSEPDVIRAYSDISGYVPNDPTTDNGTVLLDALNYWRKTGIAGGHKIAGFVAINPRHVLELESAVWLFGNVIIGLQMPLSAQGQNSWVIAPEGLTGPRRPGSWGGHCVPVVGLQPNGTTVVTWGQTLEMSKPFFAEYSDEAYAVLSTDWLETTSQVSPENFNLAQLKADLQSITQL